MEKVKKTDITIAQLDSHLCLLNKLNSRKEMLISMIENISPHIDAQSETAAGDQSSVEEFFSTEFDD